MNVKADANHIGRRTQNERERLEPAEMASLEGYLRAPRAEPAQIPPLERCFVILLNETKPAFRAVSQMTIRRQQIQARAIPIQVDGLSGYHMRPLGQFTSAKTEQIAPASLREIKDGQAYRLVATRELNLVTADLAEALERAFERFAARCGFTAQNPISIEITRGYEAGDRGHGRGMAADIQAVGGKSLAYWAQEFAKAVAQAKFIKDESERRSLMAQQMSANLGYLLYRTLLEQGGWRIYNGVVQLFGPWTPRLGPWKRLRFEYPDEIQKRVQLEQEHVYRAHRDHIHVAFG